MSHHRTIALAVFLFALHFDVAAAQAPFPRPGADTAAIAGAHTADIAGAGRTPGQAASLTPPFNFSAVGVPGQAYPFNNVNVYTPFQGQYNFNSQPYFGQVAPVGTAADRFNQIFGNNLYGPGSSLYISPTPWFSSFGIRQQLQLDALQYQQLYTAYVDAYSRYNQAIAELPATLLAAEYTGRLQALQETFNSEVDQSLEAAIPTPEVRQQFAELRAQHQNRGQAESAVALQSPLTPEQHRRLRLMAYQWNQQMDLLRKRAADGLSNEAEYRDLLAQAQEQIEAVLTPQQLGEWRTLTAPFYDFHLGTMPGTMPDRPPQSDEQEPAETPNDADAAAPDADHPAESDRQQ